MYSRCECEVRTRADWSPKFETKDLGLLRTQDKSGPVLTFYAPKQETWDRTGLGS